MPNSTRSWGRSVPAGPDGAGPGRGERRLLALARLLVDHPRRVLLVWLILVVAATPFALRLHDVLTEQGASKVVPGTREAAVTAQLTAEFPLHSERETVIVLSHWDQAKLSDRRLLAVLDGALAEYRGRPRIEQTISAYTLFRDAALGFIRQEFVAADLTGTGPPTVADRTTLEGLIAAQRLPARQADLLRAALGADQATRGRLAGEFVIASDWSAFPIPVPTRDVLASNGTVATVVVRFQATGPDPDMARLRDLITTGLTSAGARTVTAHVTGETALLQATYDKAESDNATMEYAAYLIIAVVLLLFFRAVVPAVITVVVISLAMNVSQAWLFWLGHYVHLTQFTSTIMTFVMLGAGVDYSMLLASRYRQERLLGRTVRDAAIQATARAGESVALAGSAVVLAFGATLLSPVDWIPPLGYGGLVGIPIILIAALTITPCLLALLGDRFFALGLKPLSNMETNGLVSRSLRQVTKLAAWCPLLVVLVFGAITVPLGAIATGTTLSADPVALSPATDAKAGSDIIARTWGKATLFPTVIGGRLPAGMLRAGELTPKGRAALDRLSRAITDDQGVLRAYDASHPFGTDVARSPVGYPVSSLRSDYLSRDGTVRIVVVLRDDPFSGSARETVHRLSALLPAQRLPQLGLAGATQVDQKYNAELQRSFTQMIVLVSAGLFLLLSLALRSLLIPFRLILTIMMSNIWAIAITLAVYHSWLQQPVINDLPIFLVILMMGLGMDYEIFLITRVRDLVRQGHSDVSATQTAVVDTGRVITAAGLVMAGSLGTMMLSSTLMLQQYGLGLGAAVLLDATLVRMIFVPASLLLFRKFNWWMPFVSKARLSEAS